MQLEKCRQIKKNLEARQGGMEACVKLALEEFQDKFYNQIAQLLHTFPVDHVTSTGAPFWSGPKRAPAVVKFDSKDPLHMDFLTAAANLYAFNFGVPPTRD